MFLSLTKNNKYRYNLTFLKNDNNNMLYYYFLKSFIYLDENLNNF